MTDVAHVILRPLLDGCTARPLTVNDAEAANHLLNEADRALGGDPANEIADLLNDWAAPGFDLAASTMAVFDPQGALMGYAMVWDVMNPPVHPWVALNLHPDYEPDDRVGGFLLDWAEQRAQQCIAKCPPQARVAYVTDCEASQKARKQLYESRGLRAVRVFKKMVIDLKSEPQPVNLPEGIRLRTYKHPDDLELMFRVNHEAFRDHFGFVERPLDEALRLFRYDIENDPHFNPDLWFLAEDVATGECAGYLMGRRRAYDEPDTAYINRLGVLRGWRRRGIGEALLLHSFGEFYRHGQRKVSLFVDASSPTGATRLYERAGMVVSHQWITHEKEIRAGEELANTATEEQAT